MGAGGTSGHSRLGCRSGHGRVLPNLVDCVSLAAIIPDGTQGGVGSAQAEFAAPGSGRRTGGDASILSVFRPI
eukprot:6042006-Prymnesium_polylepis.1